MENTSIQTFENFTDQLYFGLLTFNPDAAIINFVTLCAPEMLEYKKSTGWTIYPPKKEPNYMLVTNSYTFKKHPYFNADFSKGSLAINQKVYEKQLWKTVILDFKLSFDFEDKSSAEQAYFQLIDIFSQFNVIKKIKFKKGIKIAKFLDKDSDFHHSCVQILLLENFVIQEDLEAAKNNDLKYNRILSYKIIIEIGYDLNI